MQSRKLLPYILGFYTILFLFSSFVLLYQFVIPHGGFIVEDPVIPTTTITTTSTSTSAGDSIFTTEPTTTVSTTTTTEGISYPSSLPTVLETGVILGSYESENALITIYQIRASNSDVFVADVVVRTAYEILAGLAYNTFGGTNIVQTVSDMAEAHDAIFAVNSDYASHYDSGFVIRNGLALRTTYSNYRHDVVLYEDGTVSSFLESDTTMEEILNDAAWQLWSFGPVLVKAGISVADVNDGLDRDKVYNPRTAFGYVGVNHFMFVCVDGRNDSSNGVDVEELADIMLSLGCTEAYNFDGGGSATMYFNGQIINNPSEGSERKVSDCVYIKR